MLLRSVQAAFIFVVAALFINSILYASATAKEQCVTIGQKKVCFDDDTPKNQNGDSDLTDCTKTAKRGVWICCSADATKCLTAFNEADARKRMGNAPDLKCYFDASGP